MSTTKGYTNTESYVLPSKGRIYSVPVNPVIELRSMTTEDEQRRLSPSENPNKVLSEIIEECIVGEKPAVHVYDMCLGDFNFLLHKLRVVTYGSKYKMDVTCPSCKKHHIMEADLDTIEVHEYEDEIDNLKTITLPRSGKKIGLKVTTPRILDEISARCKELRRKNPSGWDPSFKVSLQYMIDTIDGEKADPLKLEMFVGNLDMLDANYLRQKSAVLNGKVGLDTKIAAKCGECGNEFFTSFRYGDEFFGPTID